MDSREFSYRVAESNKEKVEMLVKERRFCFCIPCFCSSNRRPAVGLNWWQKIRTVESEEGSLWAKGISALSKLREWSEIVAGPRWKTFIRRFNGNMSGGGSGGGRHGKFQYDPMSYSLNFDEGSGQNDDSVEDDDYRFRNFSSRYASVPMSSKTPIDVGTDETSFV